MIFPMLAQQKSYFLCIDAIVLVQAVKRTVRRPAAFHHRSALTFGRPALYTVAAQSEERFLNRIILCYYRETRKTPQSATAEKDPA